MATRDYLVRLPKDVTVVAACEQVRCENWLYGWDTAVDERTPGGRDAAAWIRSGKSGRTWREISGGGDVTVFRFEPHQRCFAEHRTRPARLSVAVGGRVLREHTSLAYLAQDYTEHCGNLAAQFERG